jgi:hypothetical protein
MSARASACRCNAVSNRGERRYQMTLSRGHDHPLARRANVSFIQSLAGRIRIERSRYCSSAASRKFFMASTRVNAVPTL